jgi:hypothetical protein
MKLFRSANVISWVITGGSEMLRKTILALVAVAAVTMLPTKDASARGGFGGGGFHGGGFHGGGGFRGGGWGGGGFRGGGWRGGGYGWRGEGYGWRGPAYGAIGLGVGLGLAGAYGGWGYPYGYGYGYPGYANYDDGGCYLVRRRVWTNYGWRVRPVQVCGY